MALKIHHLESPRVSLGPPRLSYDLAFAKGLFLEMQWGITFTFEYSILLHWEASINREQGSFLPFLSLMVCLYLAQYHWIWSLLLYALTTVTQWFRNYIALDPKWKAPIMINEWILHFLIKDLFISSRLVILFIISRLDFSYTLCFETCFKFQLELNAADKQCYW